MRGWLVAVFLLAALARPAAALDRAAVEKLATGDSDEKLEAIAALVAEGDPRAVTVLRALAAGELKVATAGKRVLIVKGGEATDAISGDKVAPLPAARGRQGQQPRARRDPGRACGAAAHLARPRRRVSPRRRSSPAAPTRRCCRWSGRRSTRNPTRDQDVARADRRDAGAEGRHQGARSPRSDARRIRAARTPRRCSSGAGEREGRGHPPRGAREPRPVEARLAWNQRRGSPSPASRSARSCCSPRSGSPSPTA